MFAVVGAAFAAQAAVTITDVSARQRWPWNSLVDVDFKINGAEDGQRFVIDITAEYADGDKKLAARTYFTDPVVDGGSQRVVWDMGADCPGFRAEDLCVYVTATPFTKTTPVYMVIDLAGGVDAVKYPVRYTRKAPVMHHPDENLQAALSDKCRTTELWLRRIPAAGSLSALTWRKPAAAADNASFWIKHTKDFYIAIFETTQQQWYQLTGEWPSTFSNETYRAVRPLERFLIKDLRGQWLWPDDKSITEGSVLKKMRDRTGLNTIDLPTSAQFIYAVTVGETGTGREVNRYRNEAGAQYEYTDIARHNMNSGAKVVVNGVETNLVTSLADLSLGTACVGTYKPNAFGLYDMLGNVEELCLDTQLENKQLKAYYYSKAEDGTYIGIDTPVVDPVGAPRDYAKEVYGNLRCMTRGGSWARATTYCNMWQIVAHEILTPSSGKGFRFVITCEK